MASSSLDLFYFCIFSRSHSRALPIWVGDPCPRSFLIRSSKETACVAARRKGGQNCAGSFVRRRRRRARSIRSHEWGLRVVSRSSVVAPNHFGCLRSSPLFSTKVSFPFLFLISSLFLNLFFFYIFLFFFLPLTLLIPLPSWTQKSLAILLVKKKKGKKVVAVCCSFDGWPAPPPPPVRDGYGFIQCLDSFGRPSLLISFVCRQPKSSSSSSSSSGRL